MPSVSASLGATMRPFTAAAKKIVWLLDRPLKFLRRKDAIAKRKGTNAWFCPPEFMLLGDACAIYFSVKCVIFEHVKLESFTSRPPPSPLDLPT
jgi:hypothetical protein